MKPKTHLVLEMAIKQGIDYGWMRAHKHTDKPNENLVKQEIETEITNAVYEWFDMEEEDD
jgi:hypothetical protein